MTQPPPVRDERIAELYAARSAWLERAVARRVRAPAATIEDACQSAWMQLARHPAVDIEGPGVLGWLITVARREAMRLAISEQADAELAPDILDRCPAPGADHGAEQRATLALLEALPARQRETVWLFATGLSYDEIARMTGDSLRTVERQLLRGRAQLRALRAAAA